MSGVVGMPTLPSNYFFRLAKCRSRPFEYFQIQLRKKMLFGLSREIDWELVTIHADAEQQAAALFEKAKHLKRTYGLLGGDKDLAYVDRLIKEFNDSSN